MKSIFFLFLFCVLCSNAKAQYVELYEFERIYNFFYNQIYFHKLIETDAEVLRKNNVSRVNILKSGDTVYTMYVNRYGKPDTLVNHKGLGGDKIYYYFSYNHGRLNGVNHYFVSPGFDRSHNSPVFEYSYTNSPASDTVNHSRSGFYHVMNYDPEGRIISLFERERDTPDEPATDRYFLYDSAGYLSVEYSQFGFYNEYTQGVFPQKGNTKYSFGKNRIIERTDFTDEKVNHSTRVYQLKENNLLDKISVTNTEGSSYELRFEYEFYEK